MPVSNDAHNVLIVDGDRIVAESIAQLLGRDGYSTHTADSAEEAMEVLAAGRQSTVATPWAVAIIDMSLGGMSGLEFIKTLRREYPDIVPLAITGYPTVEVAVQVIRSGAMDYLSKPMVDDELRIAVEKAIRQHVLLAENTNLRRQLDQICLRSPSAHGGVAPAASQDADHRGHGLQVLDGPALHIPAQ